jgi:hypothetical protein
VVELNEFVDDEDDEVWVVPETGVGAVTALVVAMTL